MAGDDAAKLTTTEATAALQQHITDKMATLQAIEKKAAEACTHVRAITLVLEEEHASATGIEVESAVAALQLAPTTASSCTPPPPSSGGEAAIVAMLHAQAYRVQNIHSIISTIMDPSSTGYA
jgi:hypothetical protein